MESLNKMEGKLVIQDRILGGNQPFYDIQNTGGVVQLAKISNKNYIDNIIGKKKISPELVSEEQKVYEMRSSFSPGIIKKEVYH